MSLYQEAVESFLREIIDDHDAEPYTHLYTPAGILVMWRKHLEKARAESEEYRKEQEREMEEGYKELDGK